MPEYLAPGVYVEETSFRASTITEVSTSTTGFAGRTRYGPVQYTGGPRSSEPRLVTNYSEFERVYGGIERYNDTDQSIPYLAHAVRAYFLNGGQRLYVSRVYDPADGTGVAVSPDIPVATVPPSLARLRARWPGEDGNVAVTFTAVRSGDVGIHAGTTTARVNGVEPGALLEMTDPGRQPRPGDAIPPAALRILRVEPDGTQTFVDRSGSPAPPPVASWLLPVEVTVTITDRAGQQTVYPRLGLAPDGRRSLSRVLDRDDPQDEDCPIWFAYDFPDEGTARIELLFALVGTGEPARTYRLTGGLDGEAITAAALLGDEADPDDAARKATGLQALAEIDDIAIVAAPDAGGITDPGQRALATQNLIRHAERARYRIAVVDGPEGASLTEIRAFRGNFDSTYAALYHPWVEILDPSGPPAPGVPTPRIMLPPSGFVTGVYARNDVTRGVFKAPANEVVYGLSRLEMNINTGRNQVLNPEHINALRFFAGRGNRVWGARTLSSNPEWLYVNVRRLFIFLEHSIDLSTQWAVFEPNGEALWRNLTRTVEDFLEVQWRNGALLGASPEEAYFVRCDRSTMTQNDLDNGRLICLIGVAPVKPAEFVIFRIGQFTADARG
ncbi:phage tail sheath family protein [Nonomuraea sp. PA05]|uniref:phage tail sheath subtilisin-like domain-containing protein n=1 Tax=Nonomuraea sp. PA05 TaxID=2604466 RepID=UPI0011D4F16D|nr:phage tail sheath subtilisin-like domain-containing protein [Nonomuraea sp. PA05]TYB64792.1 phage tail sheath family protein [Nonomuraea sp. PA05]